MKKTAYIIACYFGPRRVQDSSYINNPYEFIDWQIASISFLNYRFVQQITFVVNGDYPPGYQPLDQYLPSNSVTGIPINVLQKANHGMSYGAWNHAIETYGDFFDYYFLIEDDYVATRDPLPAFQLSLATDVGYVCSLYKWNHAAISNGLVKTKAVMDAGGIPFAPDSNYGKNEQLGQVALSKNLEAKGWAVRGLSSSYSIPFLDVNGGIIEYGNPMGPRILSPVALERGF